MPNNVRTQNGNVILKGGKVSCECCAPDASISCSGTTMPANDIEVTITRAQALSLKGAAGIRIIMSMRWQSWSTRVGGGPLYNQINVANAYTRNINNNGVFDTVCNRTPNLGQGTCGSCAQTGTVSFSLRDMFVTTPHTFYLRQLGAFLNDYRLGIVWNANATVTPSQASYVMQIGTSLQSGTNVLLGNATYTGTVMGQSVNYSKPYYASINTSDAIFSATSGGLGTTNLVIAAGSP